MNKTQKKIIGWALAAIGVLMIIGGIVNSQSGRVIKRNQWAEDLVQRYDLKQKSVTSVVYEFDFEEFLKNPLLYLGLGFGVAGAVVLAGIRREGPAAKMDSGK